MWVYFLLNYVGRIKGSKIDKVFVFGSNDWPTSTMSWGIGPSFFAVYLVGPLGLVCRTGWTIVNGFGTWPLTPYRVL